jgi:hypothetical protein
MMEPFLRPRLKKDNNKFAEKVGKTKNDKHTTKNKKQ